MKRLALVLFAGPLLAAGALLIAGCGAASSGESEAATASPPLETQADSVAMRIYEAHGGPEVWRDVPALAFTFASGRADGGDTTRSPASRHWWRRSDGAYRVEWTEAAGSTYTAVFDVDEFDREPPTGQAALNGTRLTGADAQYALRQARENFANDTYWLLAPFKLFDEGVNRSMKAAPAAGASAQDSTEAGSPARVLHLTFDDRVGITDEDRYWLTPDSTGRLAHWSFHLEGMADDQPPARFAWTGYETFETPAGPLTLSTRKENTGGAFAIYTEDIRTPASLPDSLFSME